jgi:hypothetical protein
MRKKRVALKQITMAERRAYLYDAHKNNLNDKENLSPFEVEAIYGFSHGTLAKWRMEKKHFAFIKMGKYIIYKKSDIEKYLDSCVVPTIVK